MQIFFLILLFIPFVSFPTAFCRSTIIITTIFEVYKLIVVVLEVNEPIRIGNTTFVIFIIAIVVFMTLTSFRMAEGDLTIPLSHIPASPSKLL